MKKFIQIIGVVFLVAPFFMLTSCRDGGGVSLARSKSQQDMSQCLTLLKKKKHEKAIKCFEAYKSRNYGQSGAAMADLAVGDAYFLKKDYLLAAESYLIFIESHPYHPKIAYAYYKAGVSFLKESPKQIDRDQTNLFKAIQYLGAVLKYYGNTEYAKMARVYYDQARLKQAKKHFYVGRFYFKTKEYLAAIPRFQLIVTEFPKLGLDEKSFYYLIKALHKTDQQDLATRYYDIFKEHYPQSSYVKKVSSYF